MSETDPGGSQTPNPPFPQSSVEEEGLSWPRYIWAHIGMISGFVLGSMCFGFVAFLALIGYRPAIALIICFVGFFGLIALGGRFRGR
jgi:hypothetical protein